MAGLGFLGSLGVGVGTSAVSSGLNALFGNSAASKTRKHQRWLAEYQYQKDLEMWNKQNEYNNPSNQMARLKDAGLNPNLVYLTRS